MTYRWGSNSYSTLPSVLLSLSTIVSCLILASTAQAAFVTTNEAGMDAIYSQGSFGADPIDIVWNPTITHADASLLNITTSGSLATLFGLFDSTTTLYAYFVDTVDWCSGVFDSNLVGCADLPGDDFVVESVTAGGSNGAELNGHELGHALGLMHTDPNTENLMYSLLNGDVSLNASQGGFSQASIVQGAAQVQPGGGPPNRFVTITPVLILVPEPGAAILLGLGLIGLASRSRRGV